MDTFKICITTLMILFGFTSQNGFAQDVKLFGRVVDSIGKTNLKEASILVLNDKDSIMIATTRSDVNGDFTLKNIKKGSYILLVTFPKFTAYSQKFKIAEDDSVDFNKIYLLRPFRMLQEVVVTANGPAIKFKGDTTEFNAKMFKTSQNANVEDLLRQFPGLQVDNNGKIIAYGKVVEKVLLDGEEFFSDDPTLITRNIKANTVDKVQLYDKSSDQAAFTGIKDGIKTKTIDIKLKEDKKTGYFSKIELGGGLGGFFQNQAMFNSFSGKRKFAGYFITSNTSKIGLDKKSISSYADGDSNPIANSLDSWNGVYNGVGIPKAISGGMHYSNKWGKNDKYSFNGNYKLGGLKVEGDESTLTQNNLPDLTLNTSSRKTIKNSVLRNGGNFSSVINFDSLTTVKFNFEASFLKKNTEENINSVTGDNFVSKVNENQRTYTSDSHLKAFSHNILLQKKLGKERRTFSININAKYNDERGNGNLKSITDFYTNSNVPNVDSVLQNKVLSNDFWAYGLRATYTEPIGSSGAFVLNFGTSHDNSKSNMLSYNSLQKTDIQRLDSLNSNDFEFIQKSISGGLSYIYDKNKIRFVVGSNLNQIRYKQQDFFNSGILNRKFLNLFPKAELKYSFDQNTNVSATYDGTAGQPSIHQIQPLRNNIDPLNVFIGNSFLKPFFTNSYSLNYQSFKIIDMRLLILGANFSTTSNPINISASTDRNGKTMYTYQNIEDYNNENYSAYLNYSIHLRGLNAGLGINATTNGSIIHNISNDHLNKMVQKNSQLTVTMTKDKVNSYNIWATVGTNYNENSSSLTSNINNRYWGTVAMAQGTVFLPFKFQLNLGFDYSHIPKTDAFSTNFDRFLLNGWVGKKLLKDETLMLKFTANDILNKNIGFSRSNYNNYVTQVTYSTIARYFLLSAIWDFNKNNKK